MGASTVFDPPPAGGRRRRPRIGGSIREELIEVCDFMQSRPGIAGLLGPNVDVRVRVSPSGKGFIFEFEAKP